MKVLFHTTAFYPMIGGLENVVESVAARLHERGCTVRVICRPQDPTGRVFPYEVVRGLGASQFADGVEWADVVLQANVILHGLPRVLLRRKPWVVTHQGWYSVLGRPMTLRARLKRLLSRRAHNIACSQAVAEYLGTPATVVPNPYEDDIFHEYTEVKRDLDLHFVGRLVSDKGAGLLLEAVKSLSEGGLNPTVTITGSGPEEIALRAQARKYGLEVRFTGPLRGEALAREMGRHRVLVVPSMWHEPFGVVAVEGIACGCVVVGSHGGGLKDAIGRCGVTFRNQDAVDLARVLGPLVADPGIAATFVAQRPAHLALHTRAAVGDAYLRVIEQSVGF